MNGERNSPKSPWRGLTIVILPALAAVALALYYAEEVVPALRHDREAAAGSFAVVGAAHRLERAIATAERGERGFAATGNPRYLDTYRRGAGAVPARLARLARLTENDAEQQRRLGLLRQRLDVWLADVKAAIAARRNIGFEAAGHPIATGVGVDAIGLVSGILDSIVDADAAAFGARQQQEAALEAGTRAASLLAAELVLAATLIGGGLSAAGLVRIARAQSRLRDSEERFRLLVTQVEDYAILMLDPIGRVVSWNAGAERICGFRPAEIIGRHFSCFYPEEAVRARLPERHLQHAASEGSCVSEGWRVRKDGSRYWAAGVITAVHGPEGRLRGFAQVAHEVGEHPTPTSPLVEDRTPAHVRDDGGDARR